MKVLTLKVTLHHRVRCFVAMAVSSLSTVETYTVPLHAPVCQTFDEVRERAQLHAGPGVEVRLVDARLLPIETLGAVEKVLDAA